MNEFKRTTIIVFITLFAFACGSYNKLSSVSRTYERQAKGLFKVNKPLAALEKASIGVVKDQAYEGTKSLFYKNFDKTMSSINSELASCKNSKDTAKASRQVYIYTKLVLIHTNLGQVNMPFKQHKGKWQWQTEVKDYSAQKTESIEWAYKVFYEFGQKRLQEKEIKDAYTIFVKGINRYSINKEVFTKNLKSAFNELFAYGEKYKNSKDYKDVTAAGYAFYYALQMDKTSAKAKDEYATTAKKASKMLVAEGKKLETNPTTENLVKASGFYKNAVSWDKTNQEALTLQEAIKPKIAENYYKEATVLDTKTTTEYAKVKALYENALKWVTPYKDCQARIYSLEIRQELVTFKTNVAEIEKEQKTIEPKVKEISVSIDKAMGTMNKIRFISDNMNGINNTADEIDRAISPLTGLPVIGMPLGVTLKSVNTLQIPVSKATTAINLLNDPVIIPLVKTVDISSSFFGLFNAKLTTLSTSISKMKNTISKTSLNIHKLTDEQKLKSMSISIKALNKDIIELKTKLINFTSTTSNTASAMNSLSPINPYIIPVEKGINAVKSPIASIGSSAHKINSVLDKNIALGYSARDALKLTGGLKWIMNKALGFLNPVLKELSKSLPQIPGTEAFTKELENLKPKYQTLNKEGQKIHTYYEDFSKSLTKVEKNLNSFVDSAELGSFYRVQHFIPGNKVYVMRSAGNYNYFWDLSGNGEATNKNGVNIQLWSWDKDNDRYFKFIPAGDNYYYIEIQNGGKLVTVANGSSERGATLIAWQKANNDAQKFEFIPVKDKKAYYIVNKISGKVIDAEGGNTNKNGVDIQVWDLNGGKGQMWNPILKYK